MHLEQPLGRRISSVGRVPILATSSQPVAPHESTHRIDPIRRKLLIVRREIRVGKPIFPPNCWPWRTRAEKSCSRGPAVGGPWRNPPLPPHAVCVCCSPTLRRPAPDRSRSFRNPGAPECSPAGPHCRNGSGRTPNCVPPDSAQRDGDGGLSASMKASGGCAGEFAVEFLAGENRTAQSLDQTLFVRREVSRCGATLRTQDTHRMRVKGQRHGSRIQAGQLPPSSAESTPDAPNAHPSKTPIATQSGPGMPASSAMEV